MIGVYLDLERVIGVAAQAAQDMAENAVVVPIGFLRIPTRHKGSCASLAIIHDLEPPTGHQCGPRRWIADVRQSVKDVVPGTSWRRTERLQDVWQEKGISVKERLNASAQVRVGAELSKYFPKGFARLGDVGPVHEIPVAHCEPLSASG